VCSKIASSLITDPILKFPSFFFFFFSSLLASTFKMPADTCEAVRTIWQQADAVCFDVDSTVCKDEGLDELAEYCGVGEQVRAWYEDSTFFIFYVYDFIRMVFSNYNGNNKSNNSFQAIS
jgi:hypothetical protein